MKQNNQTIDIPISVGDEVLLYNDEVGRFGGVGVSFRDTVEQYSPETNKLSFADSDVGYYEFTEMITEAERITIDRK